MDVEQDSGEGMEEEQGNPPEGLSPAKLRAWKRRQKILNKSADRMNVVSGVVGQLDTNKEEQENPSGQEQERNHSNQVAPKPKWEQRWEAAVEKSEADEAKRKDQAEIEESSAPKPDQGLRQRNVEDKDSQSSSSSATEQLQSEFKSDLGLKSAEDLRLQRVVPLRLVFVNTAMIVLSAIALSLLFVQHGNVQDPDAVARRAEQEMWKPEPADEFVLDLEEEDESGDGFEGEHGLPEGAVLFSAPYGGWVSIPFMIVSTRIFAHLLFTGIYGPARVGGLFQPSAESGMMKMALQASTAALGSQASQAIGVFQFTSSVVEDLALFAVVFVLCTAMQVRFLDVNEK